MKLELFMFEGCPYCKRVTDEIERQGRTDVELHDTRKNPADHERLVEVGGMSQVPCLFIDGEPMYESIEIVNWLAEHPQA